jgi:hypothetical protein
VEIDPGMLEPVTSVVNEDIAGRDKETRRTSLDGSSGS